MDAGKLIRNAIVARLSDDTSGLNALLSAHAVEHGVSPFAIDFTAKSNNFRMAFIDPIALRSSSAIKFPLVALYQTRTTNEDLQKFHTFSGTTTISMDVHYEYIGQSVPYDTESSADLIDKVVKTVMNTTSNQNWGLEIVYGGQLAAIRLPLAASQKGWLQTLRYQFVFEVHEQ